MVKIILDAVYNSFSYGLLPCFGKHEFPITLIRNKPDFDQNSRDGTAAENEEIVRADPRFSPAWKQILEVVLNRCCQLLAFLGVGLIESHCAFGALSPVMVGMDADQNMGVMLLGGKDPGPQSQPVGRWKAGA